MVFPQTELDVLVELDLNGWTDITDKVFVSEGIEISRGRPNEAATVDPSSCSLVLDNGDGRFSPRNPLSPYYGVLGRNTPLRVSVPSTTTYLLQPKGATGSGIAISDSASVSVTGDIDIRIELSIEDTSPEPGLSNIGLASHYNTSGNQRAWAWFIRSDGLVQFTTSPTGLSGSTIDRLSTVPLSGGAEKRALRATLDVDNGSGGNTTTFYTSDSIDGTWTQLGDPVVVSGTTSIFDSSADFFVGFAQVSGVRANVGRLYKFELRNGINGTVVANPDCTVQTPGVTTFPDTASSPNTWFIFDADITDRDYRFIGEVSEWPTTWDLSGNKVSTSVTASGILRRLDQGASPLESALTREFSNPARQNIVDYWPCEDAVNTQQIASGLPGRGFGKIAGAPEFESYSDYLASSALPAINDATFSFPVGSYTVGNETSFRVFMKIPQDPSVWGTSTARRLISARCTGTAVRWEIEINAVLSDLRLRAYDVNNTSVLTSSGIGIDSPENVMFNVALTQNGADVDYSLSYFVLDSLPGLDSATVSGTLAGRTVGKVTSVIVGQNKDLTGAIVGHVAVANDTGAFANTSSAMVAHLGEETLERLDRVCGEEEIDFVSLGYSPSIEMGVQEPEALIELFEECASADAGLLFEPRSVFGIGYRDIGSLVNQSAHLTLDHSSSEVMGELTPIDDDQYIRNAIAVEREFGTKYHAELLEGPLSVQAPPNGVGRYEDAPTVSLYTDEQLIDAANWRLHLGTVDEARYPQISVDLARHTGLTEAALQVDVGSRIVVTNLPASQPPDDASQIVQGYTERLESYRHYITFNCTPESPYRIAELDDDVLGHADTEGSELALDATSTATSLSVATTSGPIWTTDAGDFPFDVSVGGERITVTAISGASSPQTFTVTRSVNGVVKPHSAATAVRLWQPMILGY